PGWPCSRTGRNGDGQDQPNTLVEWAHTADYYPDAQTALPRNAYWAGALPTLVIVMKYVAEPSGFVCIPGVSNLSSTPGVPGCTPMTSNPGYAGHHSHQRCVWPAPRVLLPYVQLVQQAQKRP